MPKRTITKANQKALQLLSIRVKKMILQDLKYPSLDAFALEHHDNISKKTLYAICNGKRDMQLSTLLGLARALEINLSDLLSGLK